MSNLRTSNNHIHKAASFGEMMGKQAFVAWGGGKAGLYPKGLGIGGELGYTNLLGLLPIPTAGIDIGGPNKGFNAGITPSPDSEIGIAPYIGFRWNHPRVSGITRNFPRGLPEVIYDKLRGRTKQDAIRASYPELHEDEEAPKEEKKETKKENKKENKKAASFCRVMKKVAAFRSLGAVPAGVGPQQMHNALGMFNQAKALVDPTDHLANAGITQSRFERMIDTLAQREGDKYNFSELKKNPKTDAIIKGLVGTAAGGLAGKLTGQNLVNSLGLAATGGLAGSGLGYLGATQHNRDLMATAKVLKEYGLLQPEYLRSALPLLKTSTFRAYLDDRIQYEGKDEPDGEDSRPCPKCGAMKGQVHKPGCDVSKDAEGNISKTCGKDRAYRVSDMHESDR